MSDGKRCPTCGGAVRVVSDEDGTSFYQPIEAERLALVVSEARLLGEQWKRSSDPDTQRMGADLVQILNMDQ